MNYFYLLTHDHRYGADSMVIRSDSPDLDSLDLLVFDSDTFELFREDERVRIEPVSDAMNRILNAASGDAHDELLMKTPEILKASQEKRRSFVDSLDDFHRECLFDFHLADLHLLVDK